MRREASPEDDVGYIYLLRNPLKPLGVLKVGRTKRPPRERLSEYPHGSSFISRCLCAAHVEAESGLIRAFRDAFGGVFCGREYFRGDQDAMVAAFEAYARAWPCPMDVD
jgi:hypothetical protein